MWPWHIKHGECGKSLRVRNLFKVIIMKKVLFSVVAIAALTLVSCGKSACDCKKEAEEIAAKIMEDPSKAAEYAKDAEANAKDCLDFKEEDYKDCK